MNLFVTKYTLVLLVIIFITATNVQAWIIVAEDEDYTNFNVSYTNKNQKLWQFTVSAYLLNPEHTTPKIQLLISEIEVGNFSVISLNESIPIAIFQTSHKTFNFVYNTLRSKKSFKLDYAKSIIKTLNTISTSAKNTYLTPTKTFYLLMTKYGWNHQSFLDSNIGWLIRLSSRRQESNMFPDLDLESLSCDSQSGIL